MPSAADYQASILREVGAGLEGLPDKVLSAVLDRVTPYLPTYWEFWAWKSVVFPGLQVLYVKRHCLDVLMGQVRDLFPVTIGEVSVAQDKLFDRLGTLRDVVQKEIERVEKIAHDNRPVAIAQLSTPIVQDIWGRFYRTDVPPFAIGTQPPPSVVGWGFIGWGW